MKVDKILHSFNCCSSWSILADMDGSNGCCFSGATNHECGSQACCNILESPGKLEEELTPVHTYANLPKLPEESSSNGVKVGQHTTVYSTSYISVVEICWTSLIRPLNALWLFNICSYGKWPFIDDVWWFRYQDALKLFRHNKPWCLSIVVCMQPAPQRPNGTRYFEQFRTKKPRSWWPLSHRARASVKSAALSSPSAMRTGGSHEGSLGTAWDKLFEVSIVFSITM